MYACFCKKGYKMTHKTNKTPLKYIAGGLSLGVALVALHVAFTDEGNVEQLSMDELTIALSQARCGKITDEGYVTALQNRYETDVIQEAQNIQAEYERLFATDPLRESYNTVFAQAAVALQQTVNSYPKHTCEVQNDPLVTNILNMEATSSQIVAAQNYVQGALSDGIVTKTEYFNTRTLEIQLKSSKGVTIAFSPAFALATDLFLQQTGLSGKDNKNNISQVGTFTVGVLEGMPQQAQPFQPSI